MKSTVPTKRRRRPRKISSTFEFNIAESNLVNIALTDMQGRTIREVMNEFLNAGKHSITLNIRDLTRGIYFLLIRIGNDNKMIRLNVTE